MTCFEFRRLFLADPRRKSAAQEEHMAQCSRCASFAAEAAAFEARLHEAALVPVPDALADKILLRQKMRPLGRQGRHARHGRYGLWAMAATLVIGVGLGVELYRTYDATHENPHAAMAVGAHHPAIAAISYVLDNEPQLLRENRSGDANVMMEAFQRLELKLPGDGVSVRYLGKCPVPGGTGDHVVLATPYGQVTLILVPDYPVGARIMVADRNMSALASPAGKGGYILVAASPRTIRQVEKMLL